MYSSANLTRYKYFFYNRVKLRLSPYKFIFPPGFVKFGILHYPQSQVTNTNQIERFCKKYLV